MIGIVIDALILIALLKWLTDADVGLLGAILVSLGTAIGTAVLAYGLVGYMGAMAVLPAAAVASALLGVALAAIYGIDLKRAMLIGGAFMVAHIAISFGLAFLLRA